MAIGFDEANDYFQITDDASLSLPDGDWCIGIWTYVTENSGNYWQYLVSNGAWSANNTINLHLGEVTAGEVAQRNRWIMNTEDGDGTNPGDIISSTAPGADSTWRLVVFQRNTGASAGEEFEMWFCEVNAVATLEAVATDANFGAINGGDWYIGRRAQSPANRYYGSVACELFVLSGSALPKVEIEQLGRGLRVHDLGYTPSMYLEMFSSTATLQDLFGNNDASRNSAPTTEDHAPMRGPRGIAIDGQPFTY